MTLTMVIKYLREAQSHHAQVYIERIVQASDPHRSAVLLVFRSQSLKASWHYPI